MPAGKGKRSGMPTELFEKIEPLGPYNPLVWAIIWTNLAYNSVICKWYMLYVPVGETELTEEGLTFEDVVPGQTVPKNPTITVEEDSENCYVRATVTVESQDIDKDVLDLLTKKLTDQILSTAGSNWTYNDKDGYFYYGSELKAAEKAVLFETVTIPGEWDNAVADKSFSIKIAAEAVQSKYVDDVLVKDGEKVIGWNLTAEDIQEYEAKEEPKTE